MSDIRRRTPLRSQPVGGGPPHGYFPCTLPNSAFALPAAISVPFLLDHANGFILSMLFSASRSGSSHGIATGSKMILLSVDQTRLLMGGLFVMGWISQAKQGMNLWFASTLTLLIFLQFNPSNLDHIGGIDMAAPIGPACKSAGEMLICAPRMKPRSL